MAGLAMARAHSSPLLCPSVPHLLWLPADVPSVQDVHTRPRAPWMSLDPREIPASGEQLCGSPHPRALEMEVEGRGEWLRGEWKERVLMWPLTEVRSQVDTSCVFCFLFLDSRNQEWTHLEQPSAQGNPGGNQSPHHLPASGPASSLQQSPRQQPLRSGSRFHDCRHSLHGCCPDGHTTSLGPQWQGCPEASCKQSR